MLDNLPIAIGVVFAILVAGCALDPAASPPRASAETGAGVRAVLEPRPVVLYGASWCGACSQARVYLQRKGIPFVEKDIEKDSGAAWEMRAKLARARIASGAIPILDVRGTLIVGFSEEAIDEALHETSNGTSLPTAPSG